MNPLLIFAEDEGLSAVDIKITIWFWMKLLICLMFTSFYIDKVKLILFDLDGTLLCTLR